MEQWACAKCKEGSDKNGDVSVFRFIPSGEDTKYSQKSACENMKELLSMYDYANLTAKKEMYKSSSVSDKADNYVAELAEPIERKKLRELSAEELEELKNTF